MVREMNRIGVLVDLSHVTHETMNDVLDIANAPVIFSHSSARALADVERNVPDDVLRRLPRNGGLVMVSFVPYFTSSAHAAWMDQHDALDESLHARFKSGQITGEQGDAEVAAWQQSHPEPVVGVSAVADHIEYIRRIAGVDHVGLGSDFDGISAKVVGLEDVSKFPAVLAELASRGWSDEDLGKLAGDNFLRVMQEAERASGRPRGD
jgi:membrane dipeptidase